MGITANLVLKELAILRSSVNITPFEGENDVLIVAFGRDDGGLLYHCKPEPRDDFKYGRLAAAFTHYPNSVVPNMERIGVFRPGIHAGLLAE